MNPPPYVGDPHSDSGRLIINRIELAAIVLLFLIGVAVRVAFPSAMAVEHFDEGVYSSNLWCPDTDFQYPDRHLYAPSLLPALIEWSLMLFGPTRWAPMVPSLVFGSLMYFLCIRRRSLGACVWMHAVANLLLGIYVLKTRQWGFW